MVGIRDHISGLRAISPEMAIPRLNSDKSFVVSNGKEHRRYKVFKGGADL